MGKKAQFPPQRQEQPGVRAKMQPKPQAEVPEYKAADKLRGKKAIVTGGDSGIGRAVAIAFAKEGADVAIVYLQEHEDAKETQKLVEEQGAKSILIAGDVGDEEFCKSVVQKTVDELGGLNILVNNAGEQHERENLEDISAEQLLRTFKTNIFAHFYMTKAALKHLKEGDAIVCTTSVTTYQGHPTLIDYASTKGAIVGFVRSLSVNLAKKGIRVNGVAPGPIWTPLIPGSFDEETVQKFGLSVPMGRAGQPDELAPCYVFLASGDSSYMSGQVLHPNGGKIVNG